LKLRLLRGSGRSTARASHVGFWRVINSLLTYLLTYNRMIVELFLKLHHVTDRQTVEIIPITALSRADVR